MWFLVSANKADERHVFICEKEYMFGRKDCDVVLSGDPAVSRRHASIQVSHSEANVANPNKLPLIKLKDLSKFGTWVSGKKVEGEVQLKNGDRIFFGSPKSSYTVMYEAFIFTSSCLDAPSKRLTRSLAKKVGGYVVNEWCKDCSLLVMNFISVTIKVVCALVSQKHIVSPKYLEDYIQYLQTHGEKPDANKYLPSVVEANINSDSVSFLPDPRRQTLFQGMKFIFLSDKQFKKMFMAIEYAGGSAVLMEDKPSGFNEEMLTEAGTVVMAMTEDVNTLNKNMKEWYRYVSKALKNKNKKMIPDSEVGYSVLFCSTESHCNPDINKDSQQVLPDIKSQSLATEMTFETPAILAMDTEPSQQGKSRRPQVVGTPGGRKVVDETFFSKPVKKEKTSPVVDEQGPSIDNRSSKVPKVKEKVPKEVIEIKEEPEPTKSKPSNISVPVLIKTEPISAEEPAASSMTKKSPRTTENLGGRKRTRSPSPAAGHGGPEKRYRANIEEEMKEEETSVREQEECDVEEANDVTAPKELPDGFLTTRKPIKSQVVKSERYTLESELPEQCMVTTFVDLVSRPLMKTSTTRGEAVPEGYVKWKGKLVKNFKKFKKARNAGCHALPNIIGGSDLQVHVAERSSELENWFKQSIQAESQLNEEEREAQELFNFNPKSSRKKTR